jgi:hypothetical protein
MRRLLGGLLLLGSMSRGAEADCYNDQDCEPWAVCTVSLGACGSGDAPHDVCTGTCVSGQTLRVIGRAGLLVTDGGAEADLGVEIVPPLLGGHLALAADYLTPDLGRLGLALRVPLPAALSAGLRADWIAGAERATGAAAARLEWAPESALEGLTLLHYVTVLFEAGLLISNGERAGFGTFGVGLWPPALVKRR